jgi:homoserine dehydrogenase
MFAPKFHQDGIVVLKFGSSVLPDEKSLALAVHEVYRYLRRGQKVIAVVSAMGPATDRLLFQAKSFGAAPDPVGVAALAATGEAQTLALLTLALDRAGIRCNALEPGAFALRTSGPILDAKPTDLDVQAIRRALDDRPVLVVPGFIGRDELGRATLLGRGGSDFSALYIAAKLGCDCVLVKDVDGLYDRDPAEDPAGARRYSRVSYEDVLAQIEGVAQHKAVRFARDHQLSVGIGAVGRPVGTVIGPGPSLLAPAASNRGAIKVTLLGLGTVGSGVYEHLTRLGRQFEVVAVGVRDIRKHENSGIPRHLLSADLDSVLRIQADVVVETIGGLHPAREMIGRALAAGRHVVTANKAVLAAFGDELHAAAGAAGVALKYSASVGGGVPVLEAVRHARMRGPISRIRGVLNGTTNFILARLEAGSTFEAAVVEAQRAGFAEADPSADLDGIDAANKLVVLAREAFGVSLRLEQVDRTGIRAITPRDVASAAQRGRAIRLVATLRHDDGGVNAQVKPEETIGGDPLANTRDEQNCVEIHHRDGTVEVVAGRGAGRWPTAESVFADLLELSADREAAALGLHARRAEVA